MTYRPPYQLRPVKPLTKDEILAIAKRRGSFTTSFRYRDQKVDSKCRELVGQGKLKRSPYFHKFDNREYLFVKPALEE
jgi:hypothetical protein